MSTQTFDNRISQRKPLKTRVVFEDEFGEGFLYFMSSDLSMSGIFIDSAILLPVGTKLFLKFSLYEGETPISVTGEIMRVKELPMGKMQKRRTKKRGSMGIGIRFLGLTGDDLSKIEKFIQS